MVDDAWLLIRGVDASLWSHRIQSHRQILGRAGNCDIPITHPTVSRQHAAIWQGSKRLYICDLGSSNGSFVNGERINGPESEIRIGDSIQLGQVILDIAERPAADASRSPDSTLVGADQRARPGESLAGELSAGQQQVVQLILKGLSEKQVASSLRLSPHTVHAHIKQIYKLLGVRSRGELMAKLMTRTQEVNLDR